MVNKQKNKLYIHQFLYFLFLMVFTKFLYIKTQKNAIVGIVYNIMLHSRIENK
jgi:hypothetical protein